VQGQGNGEVDEPRRPGKLGYSMKIGVPRETMPGEHRVALVPASVPVLVKAGAEVVVETDAGKAAGYPDEAYLEKGAAVADRAGVCAADVVVQVRALGANLEAGITDLGLMRRGLTVIGVCDPLGEPAAAQQMASQGVNLFSLELMPRITRAQSMDVLSS